MLKQTWFIVVFQFLNELIFQLQLMNYSFSYFIFLAFLSFEILLLFLLLLYLMFFIVAYSSILLKSLHDCESNQWTILSLVFFL
jgi:uncharacterized membrane protein YhaH (DUF805 family)